MRSCIHMCVCMCMFVCVCVHVQRAEQLNRMDAGWVLSCVVV